MVELGFPGHLNAWADIKTTALPEPQMKTFPYQSTTTCSCVGVLSLRTYFPLYWKEFCLSKISKICQWSGLLLYVCESLSRVRLLVTPWTVARQAPLSMGFSRQEYWSGLPFLSSRDLPDPGIESRSLALQSDSLPELSLSELSGKPISALFLPTCYEAKQKSWLKICGILKKRKMEKKFLTEPDTEFSFVVENLNKWIKPRDLNGSTDLRKKGNQGCNREASWTGFWGEFLKSGVWKAP